MWYDNDLLCAMQCSALEEGSLYDDTRYIEGTRARLTASRNRGPRQCECPFLLRQGAGFSSAFIKMPLLASRSSLGSAANISLSVNVAIR